MQLSCWRFCYFVLAERKSYLFISTGTQSVDCSVPQGSVLGPVKFIAYTEDLMNTITSCHLNYHLYADDTQVSLGRCVHWIFIGCRHPFHQQTSTAECHRYSTLVLITSTTAEPVENGAYRVRYPLQPPEDNCLWSLAADQWWHCYQWQASSSWPGCPVGLRVNNEATYQPSCKKLLPPYSAT